MAEELEAQIRANLYKLMSRQALVAAKAAGRNVGDEEPAAGAAPTIDVSADDFEG